LTFKISVEALFFRNDFLARTAVSNIIHGMKCAISLWKVICFDTRLNDISPISWFGWSTVLTFAMRTWGINQY
jgi:hypothetical protein